MFGYIIVNKAEMKFKDFDVYQSYYCGLCKQLKKRGGNLSRLALSYDMTFVYMLLSGLYEPETQCVSCKCALHPFEKRCVRQNICADYVADMSVLLTYYKCLDDWRDERKLHRRALALPLSGKFKKVCEQYPQKTERIKELMEQLAQGETRNSSNLDEMAGLFGHIMGEILSFKKDEWGQSLYKLGFFLGKFIYIMDAYEDIEEDLRKHQYNPLGRMYESLDFEGECQKILTMMIAECSREFEKLPILEHADILRNILYSGVWVRYEAVRQKRAAAQTEGRGVDE